MVLLSKIVGEDRYVEVLGILLFIWFIIWVYTRDTPPPPTNNRR